jgi:hypothetical protein
MLDIERNSMVDTIAAVRLEERVDSVRHHLAARSTRRRTYFFMGAYVRGYFREWQE